MTISEGPGTVGTRFIDKRYPAVEGLSGAETITWTKEKDEDEDYPVTMGI